MLKRIVANAGDAPGSMAALVAPGIRVPLSTDTPEIDRVETIKVM